MHIIIKNLPETRYLVQDPSSFINLFLKKIIKKGLLFLSLKMLYKFILLVRLKGNTTLSLFFEKALQQGKMSIAAIGYNMRGKKHLVPGLISNTEARINFIKSLIAVVKKDNNLKLLPQALITEIDNLNNLKGELYKNIQSNYQDVSSTINLGKKIFNKQSKLKKNNAATTKKNFFIYI